MYAYSYLLHLLCNIAIELEFGFRGIMLSLSIESNSLYVRRRSVHSICSGIPSVSVPVPVLLSSFSFRRVTTEHIGIITRHVRSTISICISYSVSWRTGSFLLSLRLVSILFLVCILLRSTVLYLSIRLFIVSYRETHTGWNKKSTNNRSN